MAGTRFPKLDTADAPWHRSQHLLKLVLGTSRLGALAPQGLRPWVSTEVLAPSQDFCGLA